MIALDRLTFLATALVCGLAGPVVACPSLTNSKGYGDYLKLGSGFRATGPTLTLPFVMVREFPFVSATVDGVSGKLMLDTGGPDALELNDHLIPLRDQNAAGSSFYASGQHYDNHMNAAINSVALDSRYKFQNIGCVISRDSRQLEHITPDFLGWLGYGFFQNYAMKLDYRRGSATFYRNEPGSMARYLTGEQVLARMPFQLRRRPNDPFVQARLGGLNFVAVFDTGQYGSIYTSKAGLRRLEQAGVIRPRLDADVGQNPTYDVTGLNLAGLDIAAVANVAVATKLFPPAGGMGIAEPDILTIGYGVLSQFKTVWDFPNKTIYFLKP